MSTAFLEQPKQEAHKDVDATTVVRDMRRLCKPTLLVFFDWHLTPGMIRMIDRLTRKHKVAIVSRRSRRSVLGDLDYSMSVGTSPLVIETRTADNLCENEIVLQALQWQVTDQAPARSIYLVCPYDREVEEWAGSGGYQRMLIEPGERLDFYELTFLALHNS